MLRPLLGYLRLVALRKESVDRNTMRRDFKRLGLLVALRKESVDRNGGLKRGIPVVGVALRKESVDRNSGTYHPHFHAVRRSPQGERG